ncbi:MAG: MerR family transcriptional regulator [Victivallaceae bacterium]|nr:MerR family transcriptional regulator [Victivallaceae bacterium]
MEEKGYLASDLAVELALPRSTINDWLTRYADYLETETRGRRKVYSAKSLAVLREVAELRTQGAGSFEVEQTLAARHGLRPEVTAVATAAASSSSAASPEPKAASGQTLPAAPQASPVNPPALVGDKELARFAVILEELPAYKPDGLMPRR